MDPSDDIVMAYVDGELDEIGRARVEAAAAADPELRERIQTQRRLRRRLSDHYSPVTDEKVPERLRALLTVSMPTAKVADFAKARERRARPIWRGLAAIAATLLVGIFTGQMLLGDGDGPVAVDDGKMVARGALARALDRQLASAQAPDAPTRIGISFAAADGRLCRTFESDVLSGLACNEQGKWQLVATTGATPAAQREYRQASSGNILILEAAQAIMANDPLDAEGEKRAVETGWLQVLPD